MDAIDREVEVLLPRPQWTRHGFVMTSLATGFALGPAGLGRDHHDRHQRPRCRRSQGTGDRRVDPGLSCDAGTGWTVLHHPRRSGDLWRAPRISAAAWRRSDITRSPQSSTPGRATRQRSAIPRNWSRRSFMKVPTDQVMSDLDAAVAYARASGKANTAKLGITGFCWGGWATWMYSAHNPRLKAAVAWYGSDRKPTELTPKNPLDIAADVKCPVLALYGGADQSIPTARRPARRASSSSIPIRRTASMQIIGRAAAPKSQRPAGLRCTSREEPR